MCGFDFDSSEWTRKGNGKSHRELSGKLNGKVELVLSWLNRSSISKKEVFGTFLKEFGTRFGIKPEIVSYAPGRVEVLGLEYAITHFQGNHTDYNEGFVLSAAIDKGTFFLIGKSPKEEIQITSLHFNETITLSRSSSVRKAKESFH